MAKTLSKKMISLKNGQGELDEFLHAYKAEYVPESSTNKGQIFWAPQNMVWIMVMKKGNKAQVTFHAKDDCPCSRL